MTVTTPAGFLANGVSAGLKSSGKDIALIYSQGPVANAAAVVTSNRAKANPILWCQQVLESSADIRAIILNSGGANCFTGDEGYQLVAKTAASVATELNLRAEQVLVCSTGLIGEQLDFLKIDRGIRLAAAGLSEAGGGSAAEAIMTTDRVPKAARVRGEGWTIGGIAKGAGMLAPGLATMLVVLTTDAILSNSELDSALRIAVGRTFDRLDSDGCMSTNDQVTLLASGASGVSPDLTTFTQALTAICQDLAKQLQADAEGASHSIDITVKHAATEQDALEVAKAVARNNLFKAAIFGNDPNWGRILAAIGTTTAEFDPYQVDIWLNGVRVCSAGTADRPRSEVDLSAREVEVIIDLFAGEITATVLTNDLTTEYVHENSAYSS